MPWLNAGATHAQLGLPDKGHAIKMLIIVDKNELVFLNNFKIRKPALSQQTEEN